MKKIIFILSLFVSFHVFAQQPVSKSITIKTKETPLSLANTKSTNNTETTNQKTILLKEEAVQKKNDENDTQLVVKGVVYQPWGYYQRTPIFKVGGMFIFVGTTTDVNQIPVTQTR